VDGRVVSIDVVSMHLVFHANMNEMRGSRSSVARRDLIPALNG
jgi:hypothetical protein